MDCEIAIKRYIEGNIRHKWLLTSEFEADMKEFGRIMFAVGYNEGIKITGNPKRVAKYNQQGELIEIYESAVLAARKNGVDKTNICKAARGDKCSSAGFYWRYVD